MTKQFLSLLLLISSTQLFANAKSICGNTDDRILSNESKIGRLSTLDQNRGCTATLISDSCAITAGHCQPVLVRAEFNTPESINAEPQASEPQDVYMIDTDSIKLEDMGPGNDWAVFKFKKNEITGKYPGEMQGHYDVSFATVRKNATIRITGYGIDSTDETGHFAQQTHTGKLTQVGGLLTPTLMKHNADTMGGNSGSSIIHERSQKIIGIHSHGGCSRFGGANQGTLINRHAKLKAAIKACLESEK